MGQWQTIAAWAGFCDTLNIPYSNFAVRIGDTNMTGHVANIIFSRTGWSIPLFLGSAGLYLPANQLSKLLLSLVSRSPSPTTARVPNW
jgi:hypothetical protein